ncbi:hypothetical protein RND71_012669 [Anisodus tanguticus]|uniref:CW-type domain-containing protein n=1 Tax=Anisodus tanguticus TaxID=243964 RepID=A0AAE1SFW4_9SOLA|nr:hypothetical protein RND71_012669 [Anisodus tanguticus]
MVYGPRKSPMGHDSLMTLHSPLLKQHSSSNVSKFFNQKSYKRTSAEVIQKCTKLHETKEVVQKSYYLTSLFLIPNTCKGAAKVGAFAVQYARCFKWHYILTTEKYEVIREHLLEQLFYCETKREWNSNKSCEDPSDLIQDGSRPWAIDKPNIPLPPPGWKRLLRIRAESGTSFADVNTGLLGGPAPSAPSDAVPLDVPVSFGPSDAAPLDVHMVTTQRNLNEWLRVMKLSKCLIGYEPRDNRSWYLRYGSHVCLRKKDENVCKNGEGFAKLSKVEIPDTYTARLNRSVGFGVLLLEIITGRKNTTHYQDHSLNLVGYVWDSWNDDKALDVVNPLLGNWYETCEVLRCIQIGLLCVQSFANDIPMMSEVVFMLCNETKLDDPGQPGFVAVIVAQVPSRPKGRLEKSRSVTER